MTGEFQTFFHRRETQASWVGDDRPPGLVDSRTSSSQSRARKMAAWLISALRLELIITAGNLSSSNRNAKQRVYILFFSPNLGVKNWGGGRGHQMSDVSSVFSAPCGSRDDYHGDYSRFERCASCAELWEAAAPPGSQCWCLFATTTMVMGILGPHCQTGGWGGVGGEVPASAAGLRRRAAAFYSLLLSSAHRSIKEMGLNGSRYQSSSSPCWEEGGCLRPGLSPLRASFLFSEPGAPVTF